MVDEGIFAPHNMAADHCSGRFAFAECMSALDAVDGSSTGA
jgi:hypothetical protein